MPLKLIARYSEPFVIPFIGQVFICKFVKNKTVSKCYIWLILLEILSIIAVFVAIWLTLSTLGGLIFLVVFGIPMVSMYVINYEIFKRIISTTKKNKTALTEKEV